MTFGEILRTLGSYLFGTARCFWFTLGVCGVIFFTARPDVLQQMIVSLLAAIFAALAPFFPIAIFLVVVLFAFKTMFKGFVGGGTKKH